MRHYKFNGDFGQMMDKIFETAQQCGNTCKEEFSKIYKDFPFNFNDEFMDFYPGYAYPPLNSYLDKNNNLIFEFALAGFEEKDINLSLKGNYLYFSAAAPKQEEDVEFIKYFKRRLKLKNIEEQKFYVPKNKFKHEEIKAEYKNGLLRVTIPGKEETPTEETDEGIKIVIND